MPAYSIGEHNITDAAVSEEYLTKVMPMIDRVYRYWTSRRRRSTRRYRRWCCNCRIG